MTSPDPQLDPSTIAEFAEALDAAHLQARPIPQLTSRVPTLTLADAEAIQAEGFALREERGVQLCGWKMGLTSHAKMLQVGVHAPIRGRLGDKMRLADGATVRTEGFCHPRIEPEIAFVMGRDVREAVSAAEALDAVALVLPGLEIIDSRYRDFRFQLADVIADNTSAAAFVLGGPGRSPCELRAAGLTLANLGVIFEVDGQIVDTASTAAILDGPEHALAALIRSLVDEGKGLRRGDVVLAGAPTAAVPLRGKRTVSVRIEGLGEASVRVAAEAG